MGRPNNGIGLAETSFGPDFIGVGAPRAGTTWLYEVLRSHPKIWMPPIKELHYFDSIDPNLSFKRYTQKQSYRIKEFGLYRASHYLAYLANKITFHKAYDSNAIKVDYMWDKTFFGPGEDLSWYSTLFQQAKLSGLVAGEFTPDYALVNPDTAKLMSEANPNGKVLLMLRNPVGRTWSNAVFYATRKLKRDVSDISDNEWVEYCFRKQCLERSDYLRMFNTLNGVFNREQIFVGYFDDVIKQPNKLVDDVCSFLNVDTFTPSESVLGKDVNSAAKKHKCKMPESVGELLLNHFKNDLVRLSELLESKTVSNWISHSKP